MDSSGLHVESVGEGKDLVWRGAPHSHQWVSSILNYESFIKDSFFINPGLRQIFHSFISIHHRGKIFPKKEIEIKVVDLA